MQMKATYFSNGYGGVMNANLVNSYVLARIRLFDYTNFFM